MAGVTQGDTWEAPPPPPPQQGSPPPSQSVPIRVLKDVVERREGDGAAVYQGNTIWEAAGAGLEFFLPLALEVPDLLHERDHTGLAPVHHAAKSGNRPILEFLVERKFPVDERDATGQTPLMHAAANGHNSSIAYLVRMGADLSAKDDHGMSVAQHATASSLGLHIIMRAGHAPPPDAPMLHTAAAKGNFFSVLYCTEQLKLEADSQDPAGDTPLHLAARNGHSQVAGALAAKGANTSIRNNVGEAPLEVSGVSSETRSRVARKDGEPDYSNWKVLRGKESFVVAASALFLPNLFLMTAAKLPPVLGFVALVANLIMVGFITKRAASKRKPDPGLAGWYCGGLVFGSYVLTVEAFPHVDSPALKALWYIVTALMFYCYVRAFLGDPGVVRSTQGDRDELYQSVGEEGTLDTTIFCPTSLVKKPYRSKFCSTSQRPVHRFDHYCVWTCNAIGGGNFRYFFLFSVFQVLSQTGVCWFTFQLLFYHELFPKENLLSPCTWFDFFFHPRTTLATFFLVFYNFAVYLFIWAVFATQFFYVSRNVTSNEVWFPERYKWVFKLGTRVYTLYDLGFWANWREFFCGNYVGYTRQLPTMSAYLSNYVTKYNEWQARREQRLGKGRAGLPDGHPTKQGCCSSHSHGAPASKSEVIKQVLSDAGSATMLRDADTGLLIPSQMAQHLQSVPLERKRMMAEAQTKQLRELGMLNEEGTLQPVTPDVESKLSEMMRARISEQAAAAGGGGAQHSGPVPHTTDAVQTPSSQSSAMLRSRSQPASHIPSTRGKDD